MQDIGRIAYLMDTEGNLVGVMHFEINADNLDRAIKLYRDVFKWDIKPVEWMKYWLANTGEIILLFLWILPSLLRRLEFLSLLMRLPR